MRAALYMIIGAIITALGAWWVIAEGMTVMAIVAALVTAMGIALIGAGIGAAVDSHAPSSREL